MDLVFSAHAVERMQRRKIFPTDIEEIIFKSDGKIRQSRDKTIYYKRLKHRKGNDLAAVIIEKRNDLVEVLTVMIHKDMLLELILRIHQSFLEPRRQ